MTFCSSCGNFIGQANFCPQCGIQNQQQNIQYIRGLQQPPQQALFGGGNVVAIQNPLYQQQNLLGGNIYVAYPQAIVVNRGNVCRHCGQQCTPKRGRDLYGTAIKNSNGQSMMICLNTGKSWYQ